MGQEKLYHAILKVKDLNNYKPNTVYIDYIYSYITGFNVTERETSQLRNPNVRSATKNYRLLDLLTLN